MNSPILQAFNTVVLDAQLWGVILLAAAYGLFMGAVPGLTATMAVALLVPITYFMTPTAAIAAVVTLTACAIFAGDIPAALVRIPGTPASAAYAEDSYALTRRGKSALALGICLVLSVLGGLFGSAILIAFARPFAALATQFSVVEYFWFYLLGLSCAVVVSRDSALHGVLGLILGLLLSTMGLNAVHTSARFTFGRPELYDGISFIPAMIGLFGLSEVLRNLLHSGGRLNDPLKRPETGASPNNPAAFAFVPMLKEVLPIFWKRRLAATRSGLIGSIIGILPGAGADIGAWVSVAASKRVSRSPSEYGHGSVDAIADGSFANSAALAGAWIPALVFGIPGDSITAIVLGILLMKNVQPGPEIFTKQTQLIYSIYWIFILANLVLLPVGYLAVKTGRWIVQIPRSVLLPIIVFFCVVGAYAINGTYFDVGIMLLMGIAGFFLERWRIPLGPVVLGLLLGGPLEERFIQAWSVAPSVATFFNRPVAATLGLSCFALWFLAAFRSAREWQRSTLAAAAQN